MPRNEEGEYELQLGNRQLLSIFVIIVVLFGVFFAMGYITGKSSAGGTVAAKSTDSAPPDKPVVVSPDPAVTPKASAASGEVTPVSNPTPDNPPPVEKPVTPKPAQPEQTATTIAEPEAGQTFLQITAVAKLDAQMVTDTLKQRGFHARIAPGPNGLFRVLVGPAKSAAELARLRTSLDEAGFRNPIVRKY